MISTISQTYDTNLPKYLQPNPLVESPLYREWNQDIQLKNNVNTGPKVWCDFDAPIDSSLNQKLTGLANPKTLVQPVIPVPLYENSVWRTTDFMVPRNINAQMRQELWQNGYETTPYVKENFEQCPQPSLENQNLYPNLSSQYYPSKPEYPQPFMTSYGYYPEQEYNNNLPVNYYADDDQLQSNMKDYNRNIFTSILQPGVYHTSQVIQPDSVMQNLGISYDQPFLPTYSSTVPRNDPNDKTGILYTEYDPALQPCYEPKPIKTDISESDIYDPRLTGYGTSYRAYIDKMTGQPRYFYDDIDVQRQYPLITRNAIDFTDYGLLIGAQEPPKYNNLEVREMAQKTFMDNTISFRTELQERLMKKNANREWQQKQAPIITNQYNRAASSGSHGISNSGYHGPRG